VYGIKILSQKLHSICDKNKVILNGFGRWSASGESGAEDGEKRLANRSRRETPAAEPQTEARRSCHIPADACS
jgi:hypothetical protein